MLGGGKIKDLNGTYQSKRNRKGEVPVPKINRRNLFPNLTKGRGTLFRKEMQG